MSPGDGLHPAPRIAPGDRLLLCRPQGGLNDLLTQIEHACAYGEKYGRTVVVDTNYANSDYFRDAFANYFVSKSATVVLDAGALPAGIDAMEVRPGFLSGRVGSYRTHFRPGRNFLEDASNQRVSFDFNRDHPEQLLVHHASGGNQSSVLALKRVWLHRTLAARLFERLDRIGPAYSAIHIRNTDYRTDYEGPIAGLRRGEGPLFVATDSRECLLHCRQVLGSDRVFSFATLPDDGSGSLHKLTATGDPCQRNCDAILDLLTLALARKLHLLPLEKNIYGAKYSGFSLLARSLMLNPDILLGLFGQGDPGDSARIRERLRANGAKGP